MIFNKKKQRKKGFDSNKNLYKINENLNSQYDRIKSRKKKQALMVFLILFIK